MRELARRPVRNLARPVVFKNIPVLDKLLVVLNGNDFNTVINRNASGNVNPWLSDFIYNNHAINGEEVQQPVYTPNRINGKATLRFTGDNLMIPDKTSLRPSSAGINIFVVAQRNADQGSEYNIFRNWGDNGLGFFINSADDATPDKISFGISDTGDGGGAGFALADAPSAGTPFSIEYKGKAATSVQSEFYVQGVSADTSDKVVFSVGNDMRILESAIGSDYDIGLILMYMRELSSYERYLLKGYRQAHWGVA